jgi:CelD/BcsL family acetyltransferase involved in cellulose biosynthesis
VLDGPSRVALQAAFGGARELDVDKPSYYIDLEAVRASGKDFIDKLASRERTRIRQNLRKYSELGELRYDVATSVDEALAFLDHLAELHQQTWQSRGQPGAFASELFAGYHRALIRRCFGLGMIELARVGAGDATVGYHYNLVFGGRVYFYQCGYDYALGEKTSPGIVSHALAIRRAADRGLAAYELMAGDFEYKRRLATDERRMHWATWQAATMKMKGYELARAARRSLRARFSQES